MDQADNKHSRTYQACIPCRRRKVRCDLGPVDNPHEPPCVRCRREAKECFFSATRRKKRAADAGEDDDIDVTDYEIKGGRKRLKDGLVESIDSDTRSVNSPGYISHPLTPGGSLGRLQPLRRPDSMSETPLRDDETDEHVNRHTTALLQTAELHNGHDALNVLIEAATHHRTGSAGDAKRYASSIASPANVDRQPRAPSRQPVPDASIDPAIMQQPPATANTSSADHASAHAAWSRFRFVRNGWFTVKEGMAYIEYFYTYMSPLTPIALPDYRGPDKHAALLENEPMLAVTMLMIASRYMTLSGPGAQSRSHAIHARLWPFTQRMIDRIVWGRDLSGTTLSPDETQPGCDVNPMIRKGLLTLGTVESLLLLTEWHPRMMHFPADEDDTQLMAPKNEDLFSKEAGHSDDKGNGHALTSWLEPCFRSDRMCWILLNLAMTVASQIGIFDPDCSRHLQDVPAVEQDIYQRRRLHIKSLILAYITQTSGRMGVTAMLPQGYAEPALSELYNPKRSNFRDSKDVVIHFWLRLATLVKINNEELYANRQQTRDIIKTGKYRELLQRIKPSLVQWRREFETYRNIPILLRHVLIIEYEHTRVILHQLALQAVVERCANNNNAGNTGKVIPPNVLDQWFGGDRQHVDEVMQACRNVLRVVVDGLAPGGYLKHAPVRTFFRIVSVTLVLVKTFAFGAFENEMALSLSLMDRTVETMRTCVVDDVHLSTRFSTFLEVITNRLRPMIVRMSRTQGAASNPLNSRVSSRGASNSPAPQQTRASEHSNMRADGNGYSYNVHHHPDNYHHANNGRDSPSHNALYGISTQAYDIGDSGNAFSVMPPPTNPLSPTLPHTMLSNHDEYGNSYSGFAGQDFGSEEHVGAYDWLALPLDPILQSSGQDVTGTCFGPGIGDYDMLEVLLGGNSHPHPHPHQHMHGS